jgi:hypothetical protein
VLSDVRLEPDFLEQAGLLLLALIAGLALLLVLVFRVIEDLADRRVGRRGDLDEVETTLAGDRQSFREGFYADLGAVRVDEPDLVGGDPVVDPGGVPIAVVVRITELVYSVSLR